MLQWPKPHWAIMTVSEISALQYNRAGAFHFIECAIDVARLARFQARMSGNVPIGSRVMVEACF